MVGKSYESGACWCWQLYLQRDDGAGELPQADIFCLLAFWPAPKMPISLYVAVTHRRNFIKAGSGTVAFRGYFLNNITEPMNGFHEPGNE